MKTALYTPEHAAAERDASIAEAHRLYERRLAEFIAAANKIPKACATPHDRARLAKDLRDEGMTFREIGKQLGCSGSRAAQLVAAFDRKAKLAERAPATSFLSTRAFNAIVAGGLDPNKPGDIAALGSEKLSELPNVGKTTLAEISIWLDRNGHRLGR